MSDVEILQIYLTPALSLQPILPVRPFFRGGRPAGTFRDITKILPAKSLKSVLL